MKLLLKMKKKTIFHADKAKLFLVKAASRMKKSNPILAPASPTTLSCPNSQ